MYIGYRRNILQKIFVVSIVGRKGRVQTSLEAKGRTAQEGCILLGQGLTIAVIMSSIGELEIRQTNCNFIYDVHVRELVTYYISGIDIL